MTAGLIGATLLITSTTLDDAIWLVPFTASPTLTLKAKLINSITFIVTLQLLACGCVFISTVLHKVIVLSYASSSSSNLDSTNSTMKDHSQQEEEGHEDDAIIVAMVGAIMCWSIAIFLYVKKLLKRRRKNRKLQGKSLNLKQGTMIEEVEKGQDANGIPDAVIQNTTEYGTGALSTMKPQIVEKKHEDIFSSGETKVLLINEKQPQQIVNNPSFTISNLSKEQNYEKMSILQTICMISSLTTLGALDEISYFPTLIMGNVFSPYQLCFGTFLASLLILIIVTFFLAKCKPMVDFLDSIPLYGIVFMFAIILTFGVVWDMISRS